MVAVLGAWRIGRDVEPAMRAAEGLRTLQAVSPIGLWKGWDGDIPRRTPASVCGPMRACQQRSRPGRDGLFSVLPRLCSGWSASVPEARRGEDRPCSTCHLVTSDFSGVDARDGTPASALTSRPIERKVKGLGGSIVLDPKGETS